MINSGHFISLFRREISVKYSLNLIWRQTQTQPITKVHKVKTKARRVKLSVTLFTFKSYTSSSRTEALTSSQDALERHVAQDCTSPLYSTMHDKSSRSEDLPWSRARFPRSEMFLCCRSYHLHTVY